MLRSRASAHMHHDAFLFVHAIRKRYWLGMLAAVESALITAERSPVADRRAGTFSAASNASFVRFLRGAKAWLLSEGRVRPEDLPQELFLLLKPLCEHLVETGRFPEERLDLFRNLAPYAVGPPAVWDVPEPKDPA